MTITPEQLIARKNSLGSSDIAALFTDTEGKSLDPFKTAKDVWISKVFDLAPMKETKAIKRGNRHEAAMVEYACEELGCPINTNPAMMNKVCEGHPIFVANLDGITLPPYPDGMESQAVVEAKTSGLADEWGEPGTDAVPFRVLLQVQHQMLCSGYKRAYIAPLLGGHFGLNEEMYIVDRSPEIIYGEGGIVDKGTQFWHEHVLPKVEPPDAEPGNIDLLKRIRRVPSKYAEVDEQVVLRWDELRLARLEANKAYEDQFTHLLSKVGDAEGILLPDGRTWTYFKQKRADKVDLKKLKTEHPDIYAEISEPNTCRVARLKKA